MTDVLQTFAEFYGETAMTAWKVLAFVLLAGGAYATGYAAWDGEWGLAAWAVVATLLGLPLVLGALMFLGTMVVPVIAWMF